MNDVLNEIWQDLSYTIKKKTEKIQKLNTEIKASKKKSLPTLAAAGVLTTFYVLPNAQMYLSNITSVSTFGLAQSKSITFFDIAILFITLGGFGYGYLKLSETKKLKSKYESLRKNIIESLGQEFCKHCQPCQCKDTYIKGMEQEGIDLIFS